MPSSTMRAIVIPHLGCSPAELQITDHSVPTPSPGHAIIAIKAFGINHAEMHMRRGEWPEATPISGIECVGTIDSCPSAEFALGDKVAATMGGLGRSINGTYAEYTKVPLSNVMKMDDGKAGGEVDWAAMAAIPESYATAWTVLFRNLEITAGQKILVRGATSALGKAAIHLAVNKAGAEVWATTRREAAREELMKMGVKGVFVEDGSDERPLSEKIKAAPEHQSRSFDAVLLLTGNAFLLDTLRIPRRGGRVCLAGFLSGLGPIADFNPILQMASGVQFSFFGSFVFGTSEFPMSDVPLKEIMEDVKTGKWNAAPARVFKFEEVAKAHELMENGQAGGKMVVVVS